MEDKIILEKWRSATHPRPVSLRGYHIEWLDDHPEINLSLEVRGLLDKMRENGRK